MDGDFDFDCSPGSDRKNSGFEYNYCRYSANRGHSKIFRVSFVVQTRVLIMLKRLFVDKLGH